MTPVPGAEIASVLGLSPAAIAGRRAALGLDDAARSRLRHAAPAAKAAGDLFVERLYVRLRSFPDTQALLVSDDQVRRLKALQRGYLRELFEADLDWSYVLQRLTIGEVHHRVRLAPQWFVATYAHLINEHVEALMSMGPTVEEGCERVCALIASVCFDAALVLDSYGRREEASLWLRAEAEAAEHGSGPAPTITSARASSAIPGGAGTSRIRLSSEATDERCRFLELSDADRGRLRGLRPLIAAHTPEILEEFYAHLASVPETAALVPPHTARRLIQQVASYWLELAEATFDRSYAASRMRVGVIHEKVGVDTSTYLNAVGRQLSGLVRAIGRERPAPEEDIRSLVRAVFFDLTFVLDAYMEARIDRLLETEGYANQLVAGLASAVAVIDANDRLISANRTLLGLIGGDAATLYLLPLDRALPVPEAVALVRRLRASGRSREMGIGRLGGRTVRCTAMRLAGQGAAAQAVALVIDDVTDILRLGESFSRQADQFEQVADTAGAVLWEMEPDSGTITAINGAALDLTGYRDVYFLGRPRVWHAHIVDEDRTRVSTWLTSLPVGTAADIEYRMTRADGAVVWVRTLVRRASSSGDDRLRGVTLDVSATKRAEALRLEALGNIAGGVAHVVNNALTAVVGNVDLQALDLGGMTNAPHMQEAMRAAHRVRDAVAQLLTVAGQQMQRPVPLSVSVVCAAAEARLRTLLGSSHRLQLALDPDVWPCRVDRQLLDSALECLVKNAREAMSGPGEVLVATHARAASSLAADDEGYGHDWVEIEVADNGCGMPEWVRVRALEPFFTTRSASGAAGLGLSMAYGFVKQTGGQLRLESEPEKGTRVTLRFPRYREVATAIAHEPARPVVLVVEDQPDVRRLTVTLVERLGYDVRAVASAEAALELAQTVRPAILLTDVVLGVGADGVMLAQRLAALLPQLAIVMMSGYARSQFDLAGLPPGTQFLAKPFVLEDLASTLRAAAAAR